ncbi:MAG: N-acetyltransferase [Chloroflexota bacterium]
MNITIRNEQEADYHRVEEITREAFWNLFVPGCAEHYLVHVMRNHKDFIPSLDFVAIHEENIVGNIMYTRSWLINEQDERMEILTFGPVSVLPEYQRQGIGSRLIQHTKSVAIEQKQKAIIIYGHPQNYCKHGFKSSRDYGVSTVEGKYPYSLLVLELEEGILKGHRWKYQESNVYSIKEEEVEEYDKNFSHKEKGYRYTQEEFLIACRAYLE